MLRVNLSEPAFISDLSPVHSVEPVAGGVGEAGDV